ncbi:hypothetical protein E4U53_008129, partial [Claviceps sorghi]
RYNDTSFDLMAAFIGANAGTKVVPRNTPPSPRSPRYTDLAPSQNARRPDVATGQFQRSVLVLESSCRPHPGTCRALSKLNGKRSGPAGSAQ